MPTQSNTPTPLSVASLSGGGKGGGSNGAIQALLQQIQKSQQQFSSLISTVEQLQQQNAQSVQEAGQAAAGGATEVANSVAANLDRQNQRAEKKRDRLDDRAAAEDFARLQAKLAKDASLTTKSMAQDILAQRQSILSFTQQFDSKKASIKEALDGLSAQTDEMLQAGYYDSVDGRKALKKMLHTIDLARTFSDDHFDDRHLQAAYKLQNENIQRIIAGQDPLDLSRLRVDPLLIPYPETEDSGKRIAEPGELDPETNFQLKMMGGYPPEGVMFNNKPNHGLPEGYEPKFIDAETMLQGLRRDQNFQFAADQSIRRQIETGNAKILAQAQERLAPLLDTYNSMNSVYATMAPNAIQEAFQEFMDDTNPRKFDDVGRSLTALSLKAMFGGGSKGEQMALFGLQLFDGKAEVTTPEQAMVAMALESASFSIQDQMVGQLQLGIDPEKDGGSGSFAVQLVQQSVARQGLARTLETFGVANTGEATNIVAAQAAAQRLMIKGYSYSHRLHDGMWRSSVLEDLRKDLRATTKLSDTLAFGIEKSNDNVTRRLAKVLGQDEVVSQTALNNKGTSPQDLEAFLASRDDKEIQQDFNFIDAMIGVAQQSGPDQVTKVASFLSGGVEAPESPNLQEYLKQTRISRQGSGYINAAAGRASHNQRRRERAREEARNNPTPAQSFQQGGAVQTLKDQAGPLVSLSSNAAAATGIGVVANTVGGLLGPRAARTAVRGISSANESIAKKLALTNQPGPAQDGVLTPQERNQVIEGN